MTHNFLEYRHDHYEPPCVVVINNDANDTEVPQIEYDEKECILSFEWQGAVNAYFKEYNEFVKRKAAKVYISLFVLFSLFYFLNTIQI